MSLSASPPASCQVLVIGAGPAGSACARALALAGVDVCLVDAQSFPRDKVCGDGLIPDALEALEALGLGPAVRERMQSVQHAHCRGPSGGELRIEGDLGVWPRRDLDDFLMRAALDAGARVFMPWKATAVLEDVPGGQVQGARLMSMARNSDQSVEVRADLVILATGASASALKWAGVMQRQSPSSVAARAYVRLSPELEAQLSPGHEPGQDMHFVWHRQLRPGYGWIFPLGQGLYNLGVGVDGSHEEAGPGHSRKKALNLRDLLDRFCAIDDRARLLRDQGIWESDFKGASMRCGLQGARWTRPGLWVVGEAAGCTYAFTGEGIGKALATGLAAARAWIASASPPAEASEGPCSPPEPQDRHHPAAQGYEAQLRALRPRYALYEKATQFHRLPWTMDLVIWRARRSARLRQRLADVLAERALPGRLLSWRGLRRWVLG